MKYRLIIVSKKIFQSIDKICEGLQSKVNQFVENDHDKIHEILLKYRKNIDRIKTVGQLEQFLYFTPKRFKLGARISVQPTSISRRKPGIIRGSKRLPAGSEPKGEHHIIHQKVKHVCNLSKNIKNNGRNKLVVYLDVFFL